MSQSNSPPPPSFDEVIVWGYSQRWTVVFPKSPSVLLSVTISSNMTQLSLFEMGRSQALLSKGWRMTLTSAPTPPTHTHPAAP